MALADMVIVIVEIADVVLKQMKDNVITATFKVVYMSSSFWLSAVESRDLSQAEKKIPAFKAEQINKMTTILWIFSALQAVIVSQLEINHVIQQPTEES